MDVPDSKINGKKSKSVTFSTPIDEPSKENARALDVPLPTLTTSLWTSPLHYLFIIQALYTNGLTSNPYRLMLVSAPVLALAQFVYGVLLKNSSKYIPHRRLMSENSFLISITATVVSLLLANVTFVILILMGAPLATLVPETYILSVHLSLLVVQPVLVSFRLEHETLIKLFRVGKVVPDVFTNEVLCSSLFAIIGAWFGVLPIPLDWDRPWQQWPLTILTGAYLGGFIGHSIVALRTLIF